MTNGNVKGTSTATVTSLHHLLSARPPPNDHFAMCDNGHQKLDNRKIAAQAEHGRPDVCDSAGRATSNDDEPFVAHQRGERGEVEMDPSHTSDRAGGIDTDGGHDASSRYGSGRDDYDHVTGWYRLLCDVR